MFSLSFVLGCGKSYLLRVVIDALEQKFGYAYMVAVTATTGMAGSRINGRPPLSDPYYLSRVLSGQTIHSWAGLTGLEATLADALKRIKSSPQSVQRWNETKVLVCDEGSSVPLFKYLFSLVSRLPFPSRYAFRRHSVDPRGVQV
jgi:hypothetical protein